MRKEYEGPQRKERNVSYRGQKIDAGGDGKDTTGTRIMNCLQKQEHVFKT